MSACPWCDDIDTDDPTHLCRMHTAEYLGTSVADLDRGEAEQYAEYFDTLGY
jgi:hypothetical protein